MNINNNYNYLELLSVGETMIGWQSSIIFTNKEKR